MPRVPASRERRSARHTHPGCFLYLLYWNMLEQVRVGAEPVERKHEDVIDQLVHEQPIRFDVAFPGALVLASKQRMVVIFLVQGFAVCEFADNGEERFLVFVLLLGKFVVPLEAGSHANFVLHSSKAFLSSSVLLYVSAFGS